MSQSRQPKGIPSGGQFAASSHDEAAGSLSSGADSAFPQSYVYDGEVLDPQTALDRWVDQSEVDYDSLIEGMDGEEAREAVFANTTRGGDPAANIEGIRYAAVYNGFDDALLDLPTPHTVPEHPADAPAFSIGFPDGGSIGDKVDWALENDAVLTVDMDPGEFDLSGDDLREEWENLAPGEGFEITGARFLDPAKDRNPYGATDEAIRDVDRVEALITDDIDHPEAREIQSRWRKDGDFAFSPDYYNALATYKPIRAERKAEVDGLLDEYDITRAELDREISNEFGMPFSYDDGGTSRFVVEHHNRILNRISLDYLEEIAANVAHEKRSA